MIRTTLGLDRSTPLYFAGRTTELAALDAHLADVRRGERCGMALIDGIPGVGKTQLLREFAKRAQARDSSVRHIDLQTNDLNDPAAVIFESIKAPLLGEGETFRDGTASGGLGTMLRTSASALWQDKALIVTVDEVQNVSPVARSVLSVLHEGTHGRPIMAVAAGLTNAMRVLSAARETFTGTPDRDTISRIATVLTLGPLSRAETNEALTEIVSQCTGLAIPCQLLDTVAEASSGFPQHVHCYARACVETAEVLERLDTPDAMSAIVAMGDGYRKNYYDLRLKTINQRYRPVAVQLAHGMAPSDGGPAMAWNEAVAVVERTLNSRLEDGHQVVELLLDKGILALRPRQNVASVAAGSSAARRVREGVLGRTSSGRNTAAGLPAATRRARPQASARFVAFSRSTACTPSRSAPRARTPANALTRCFAWDGAPALRDNGEVFFPMPSFHGYMMSFAPPSRRGRQHGLERQ